MSAGRFITFEGGEGAGKSTQARLLADALCDAGIPTLLTREPGGAPGSEVLRGLLLDGPVTWSPLAQTLLHVAARAEHVAHTIRPALAAGQWVVCDRFSDSTRAYQGGGQGMDRAIIETLLGVIDLQPDLTMMLNVTDQISRQRLETRGGRADHYERQDADFHARVDRVFRQIAADDPARCANVAAAGPPDAVHRAVREIVRARLGGLT